LRWFALSAFFGVAFTANLVFGAFVGDGVGVGVGVGDDVGVGEAVGVGLGVGGTYVNACGRVAVCPSSLVTDTSAAPATPAGVTQVIVVADTTTTDVHA